MITYVAIDQYGTKAFLKSEHPRKELMEMFCAKKAARMYCDGTDGKTYHTGYIIKSLWFTVYGVEGRKFRKEA